MSRMSLAIISLSVCLIAAGATAPLTAEEAAQSSVYWDAPNSNYVSTAWSIGEDDDLLNIREIPVLEGGFIEVAPERKSDGIAVGELGADGGDRETHCDLVGFGVYCRRCFQR